MVGDFHSFQGQPEEVQTLKFAKRSVVKQLTMTHRRGWVGHTLGEFHFFSFPLSSSLFLILSLSSKVTGHCKVAQCFVFSFESCKELLIFELACTTVPPGGHIRNNGGFHSAKIVIFTCQKL